MSGSPTVFFYVQHLLGIGHVFRATRVARALARAGASVHVVWGGTRLPAIDLSDLEMVWLEPLRSADAMFSELVRPDGTPADAALLETRKQALLDAFRRVRPDILVTEMFPFGRRQMRFELEPLMRAATAADWPLLRVSSIRDILPEGRREKRIDETLAAVREWFDLVLVHGDPTLIELAETFPRAAEIAHKLRYTGIVAPPAPDLAIAPTMTADVVVSAGGGAVGHALTAAAIDAPVHSKRFPRDWLLVVGPERSQTDFDALAARAGPALKVVRFVPDLARIMAAARVSVSRAGYNTIGDILRAGCPRVLAPFTGGRETEQLRRAQMLAERGVAIMVRDEELTPLALAEAVDRAAASDPAAVAIDLDGDVNSANILMTEWRSRIGAD